MRRSVEQTERLSMRLLLRQRYHSWRLCWRSIVSPNTYVTPIFLFSPPRTGSSLLSAYTNQHPDLHDCGEVLNQRIARGLSHRKFGAKPAIRHIKKTMLATDKPYCLMKLHFNHLKDRKTPLQDLLESFPNAKIVVLLRQSILEQYCSQVIATETRNFTNTKNNNSPLVFNLDFAKWESYRASQVKAYRDALSVLDQKGSPYVLITYEDLSSNPDGIVNRQMFPFLGLAPVELANPVLKKQEKREVDQIISNYEELDDRLMEKAEILVTELRN